MTRDRMPDLCAGRKCNLAPSNSFLKSVKTFRKQNQKLHDLLDDAQETRGLIDVMIENVVIVKNVQSDVLLHTNREIQKELEGRTYTINQLAHRIYNKLRDLGKDINSVDDLSFNTPRDGSAYDRIKILQYTTMYKMYTDVMQDYNENLLRYHEKCSSLLHRQRRLLRRQITSQEIEDMIESQDTSLFVDNILAETKEAQQQLSDLETRHNELQKLEKSITEVRNIFFEMGLLVERQGEQLDCVENIASKTATKISIGANDIIKQRERKEKQRKRKIKLALIVCIIIIIIFLIVICS